MRKRTNGTGRAVGSYFTGERNVPRKILKLLSRGGIPET